MALEQLAQPAKHLMGCDISDTSKDLWMDQHANAFLETLLQSVQKDTGPGIEPGLVPGNGMGQETGTVIDMKTHVSTGRIAPNVKTKSASIPLLRLCKIGSKPRALMERQHVVKEPLSREYTRSLWKETERLPRVICKRRKSFAGKKSTINS
jgi:hypothetical protein